MRPDPATRTEPPPPADLDQARLRALVRRASLEFFHAHGYADLDRRHAALGARLVDLDALAGYRTGRRVPAIGCVGPRSSARVPAVGCVGPRSGAAVSVRIPFTSSNLSLAGSIDAKAKVAGILPTYLRGRIAGNQNLINYSETLTIGPAQGAGLVVIGHQAGAPVVDLHLAAH